VDFVRKSIKAIGQTAVRVKIESAAERCVKVLLELMATRVSYVVEAVVVMKVLLNCVEVFRLLLVLVLIISFIYHTAFRQIRHAMHISHLRTED